MLLEHPLIAAILCAAIYALLFVVLVFVVCCVVERFWIPTNRDDFRWLDGESAGHCGHLMSAERVEQLREVPAPGRRMTREESMECIAAEHGELYERLAEIDKC